MFFSPKFLFWFFYRSSSGSCPSSNTVHFEDTDAPRQVVEQAGAKRGLLQRFSRLSAVSMTLSHINISLSLLLLLKCVHVCYADWVVWEDANREDAKITCLYGCFSCPLGVCHYSCEHQFLKMFTLCSRVFFWQYKHITIVNTDATTWELLTLMFGSSSEMLRA